MTTEHRKSPRRKIADISRVGGWGNVKYHHHLECGHVEVRPRASSAPKLACLMCLKVKELDAELTAVEEISPESIDFDETAGKDEVRINKIAATIASRFGIPVEAVSIQSQFSGGRLQVGAGYIFLGPNDVERLGEQ